MKKFFSLSLALLLCVALSVPAFAVERAVPTRAEALASVQITLNQGGGSYDFSDGAEKAFFVESPMVLDYYYDHTVDDYVEAYPVKGYHAGSENGTITVRHNGKAGDRSIIKIFFQLYKDYRSAEDPPFVDGVTHRMGLMDYRLVTGGKFFNGEASPEVLGLKYVDLSAGQSVTFSLPFTRNTRIDWYDADTDLLEDPLLLCVKIFDPDFTYKYETTTLFKLDEKNAAVKSATTAPTQPTAPAAPSFADVKADAYYAGAVKWAVEKGITAGTTATTFSPNNTCTTAQILTFLWRANGSPAPTGNNAAVPAGQYYTDAANWALEKGLTDNFSADTPATRAATVTYLWKLAGKPAAEAAAFTDVDAGAEYAQAVAWAVKKGVTAGTSATTFAPDNTCTRGQIVTFLYRDLA